MPVKKQAAKPAAKPAVKPAVKPATSQAQLKAKVDECHICCKKLEKEISDLKKELSELKSQKSQESAKDERLDELIQVLKERGTHELKAGLRKSSL